MTFDMLKEFDSFLKQNVQEKFDWVTALPVYQHIYIQHYCIINPLVINYTFENLSDHYTNTGCSPFEVFYGRQSNFETSSATGGEDIM